MKISMLLAGAAALAVSASVHADLVQVRDAVGGEYANGFPGGPLVVGTGSESFGQAGGNAWGPKYVGTFDLEANYGSGFQSFRSYCIEPDQDITFDVNPPDSIGVTYATDSLLNHGFTAGEEHILEVLWANAFALSMTSQANAAAFQWFVWELTEDNSFDLLNGNTVMATIVPSVQNEYNIAQGWYNNIIGGTWTSTVDLQALTNPDSQDFIAPVIPAPGAGLAMVLGLAGMGRRRRA